ncbi:phosphatidylglycerophosphatase A, partial [Aerococcus urinae]
ADRRLKGGIGIMAGDMVAALYAILLILVCRHFTGAA